MIVKNGRLYLWKNKIADDELYIKIGTGAGSSEFVEINQTDLVDKITDATIMITSEDEYNVWNTDRNALNGDDYWHTLISNIDGYVYRVGDVFSNVAGTLSYYFGTEWIERTGLSTYIGTTGTAAASGGVDGDYYFKTDTLELWLNDTAVWELVIPTSGDIFATVDGVTSYSFGVSWIERTTQNMYIGTTGTAAAADGADGDYYFKTDTSELWYNDTTVWGLVTPTDTSIISNRFIFEDERKIIIYIRISTEDAFELGEMGLFVKAIDPVNDIMISRNLMHKQWISSTESKVIRYTINI